MLETEKSFKFLQEGIPQWLQDIAKIEEKVTAMQDQLTKVSMPATKRKTDSIESIRPTRLPNFTKAAVSSHGAQTDPLGNRNRRTHSALSGPASGPSRYTPKQMIIVEYDGDMQKSFEMLVRAIGTGRNMLRKAKMEVKLNELAALAASSEDDEDIDEDEDEPAMPRTSYRPRMSSMRAASAARRSGRLGVAGTSKPSVELLDTTDKLLESAQGLCERAAHLTLRDGDCRKEMGRVRKHFDDIFETAKTEVVKSNARKLQELQELEECPSQDTSDTSISSMEPSCKPNFSSIDIPPAEPEPQPNLVLAAIPTAPKNFIEVDDIDDEEEFVMPPIRLMSRIRIQA